MMKLPVEDAVDTDDFKAALSRLNHCDLILIDSVGASQYDREKLLKIAHFLESTPHQIDVNLCVAASTKLEDLREIHENFSLMELDTMIVTKFDETKGFGNVFSLASETALPLSYFCLGQEVPDDMMPASSDFLIECIFEGYQGRVS
jgi:flagellar biosynthesis protein FlhF